MLWWFLSAAVSMGYRKPELSSAWLEVSRCMAEIKSPYNDGYTSSAVKQDLYNFKVWLDEQYARLPRFVDEDQWEKQRVINILSQ